MKSSQIKLTNPVILDRSAKKLHLGCGHKILDDWINCDIKPDKNIIKWDLTQEPPFDNNSIDFIFSEHVLEHFTLDEGFRILVRCRKIMKPGSIIRIAVPDLNSCIREYQNKKGLVFRNEHQKQLSKIRINAEFINKCFREHGHKFLYDFDALAYNLKKAGFINVKRFGVGESSEAELKSLETRIYNKNSSQVSLCIEAKKKG